MRSRLGNVRQLRMALHHALVVADGARTLEPWHLPELGAHPSPTPTPPPPLTTERMVDTQVEAVRRALSAADGNVSAAARALGVARSTVYRILRRHGMGAEGARQRSEDGQLH